MKTLLGKPGTASGLMLRLGQCLFAGSSIGIIVTAYRFSNYTAFCYLIASMGLQLLWSFGLACLDIYAVTELRDLTNPILVSLFVVCDWVTATLTLAVACSSAGVMVLYAKDLRICARQKNIPCGQYQISIALAFVTWFLVACSSHGMFWVIASL